MGDVTNGPGTQQALDIPVDTAKDTDDGGRRKVSSVMASSKVLEDGVALCAVVSGIASCNSSTSWRTGVCAATGDIAVGEGDALRSDMDNSIGAKPSAMSSTSSCVWLASRAGLLQTGEQVEAA